jgi:hypothetical protein
MNGAILTLASISFIFAGLANEYFQHSRFEKFKKDGFFKTGYMGVSNEKARPVMEDFPIEKFYPRRMVVHIDAKERFSMNKNAWNAWKISDEHSHVLVPKLDIDIFNEFSNEESNIRFDNTYTVDTDTLVECTTPPIVIGRGEEGWNLKEIDIVRNQFKEYHLVHISERGNFSL